MATRRRGTRDAERELVSAGAMLVEAQELAEAGANNERSLALATIALAQFTWRGVLALERVAAQLEHSAAEARAYREKVAGGLETIVEQGERAARQQQRVANHITSSPR